MKYLIVGLGNPSDKYRNNRHNVGFMFVDYVVTKTESEKPKNEKKFDAEIAEIPFKGGKALVAKPQSYMNRSGDVVHKISDFYKIAVANIMVVHDDLDIPLGRFRIHIGTSPLTHNGIASIDEALGTKGYTRIRIGIENREAVNHPSGEDYVLSDFTQDEQKIIEDLFPQIWDRISNS